MPVIYQPSGRAREYSPLACNIYLGCTHACRYCYAPRAAHSTSNNWHAAARPRRDIIKNIQKDAGAIAGDQRDILFSFLSDPYQPADCDLQLTRSALKIMGQNRLHAQILTKGGLNVTRDFDLFSKYRFKFGSTILFTDDSLRAYWEPAAPTIESRMEAVRLAHRRGIYVWISLEPVIDAGQALEVIKSLHKSVDFWKIGKLNYLPSVEKQTDWGQFRREVVSLLKSVKARYMLKRDLLLASAKQ